MADSGFVKVAQVSDLPPGDMMVVEVGDERVLLANVGGNVHAMKTSARMPTLPYLRATCMEMKLNARCTVALLAC